MRVTLYFVFMYLADEVLDVGTLLQQGLSQFLLVGGVHRLRHILHATGGVRAGDPAERRLIVFTRRNLLLL